LAREGIDDPHYLAESKDIFDAPGESYPKFASLKGMAAGGRLRTLVASAQLMIRGTYSKAL
jgi:hypothetical protein